MRTLAVAALASLAAFVVASSAIAAPTVSLYWEGTSGSSSIASSQGDTVTLYVQVNPDAGVTAAQLRLDVNVVGTVSVYYDPTFDGITSGGVTYTPAASATYGGGGLTYLSSAGCPAIGTGEAIGNLAPGVCGNGFQTVTGPGSDLGGGLIGPWGHLSVTSTITLPYTLAMATFEVVPEPATGGLLALGLGALAFIGRRRA